MPKARKRYKPEVKAKIVEAAATARAADKPWKDAHIAAQKLGYKGNVGALMQMMAKQKAKKVAPARKPGRPAKATAVAPAPKKRGRPAKAKVAAPAIPALDPVAAQYLVSAIDKAIAELQKLRQQYTQ
jgi:hypothetical protein